MTLEDNLFGDITFEKFYGQNIHKIGSNVFNKTANKIELFNCGFNNSIEHQPPKYDLKAVFDQMTRLKDLDIGLNVTEIPTNSIEPIGNQTSLQILYIRAKELTIKSGAFQQLKNINFIEFLGAKINRIEKEAFKLNSDLNDKSFQISFVDCLLTDQSFQNGSFDGIPRNQIEIEFQSMNISSLPEVSLKTIFDNKKLSINFNWHSTIDCDDCKNYWLIKGTKENNIKNALCKGNDKKTLFDQEIKTKLSQKCK